MISNQRFSTETQYGAKPPTARSLPADFIDYGVENTGNAWAVYDAIIPTFTTLLTGIGSTTDLSTSNTQIGLLKSIKDGSGFVPTASRKQLSVFSNTNLSVAVTANTNPAEIGSLYFVNSGGAVAAHYLGIVEGTTALVSGTTRLVHRFWNSGTNGASFLFDNNYFFRGAKLLNGFQIVRSSNPLVYTQLGANLANNVSVTVNYIQA